MTHRGRVLQHPILRDADVARDREMAIHVEATHVALAQVQADPRERAMAGHGACETIALREREEARAMVAHIREELRAALEARAQQ